MKTGRPYDQVIRVANKLVEYLSPFCQRIEIAGSLRRRKDVINDIEIVAVPTHLTDLFGNPIQATHLDIALDDLMKQEKIRHKEPKRWGQKYKAFIVESTAGELYQVDLFLPSLDTWGCVYMIRTGSAEFSKRMVTPKKFGGLMPNDLRVQDARVWRGNECLPTLEEGDLFRLWGMKFVQPEARV